MSEAAKAYEFFARVKHGHRPYRFVTKPMNDEAFGRVFQIIREGRGWGERDNTIAVTWDKKEAQMICTLLNAKATVSE